MVCVRLLSSLDKRRLYICRIVIESSPASMASNNPRGNEFGRSKTLEVDVGNAPFFSKFSSRRAMYPDLA